VAGAPDPKVLAAQAAVKTAKAAVTEAKEALAVLTQDSADKDCDNKPKKAACKALAKKIAPAEALVADMEKAVVTKEEAVKDAQKAADAGVSGGKVELKALTVTVNTPFACSDLKGYQVTANAKKIAKAMASDAFDVENTEGTCESDETSFTATLAFKKGTSAADIASATAELNKGIEAKTLKVVISGKGDSDEPTVYLNADVTDATLLVSKEKAAAGAEAAADGVGNEDAAAGAAGAATTPGADKSADDSSSDGGGAILAVVIVIVILTLVGAVVAIFVVKKRQAEAAQGAQPGGKAPANYSNPTYEKGPPPSTNPQGGNNAGYLQVGAPKAVTKTNPMAAGNMDDDELV